MAKYYNMQQAKYASKPSTVVTQMAANLYFASLNQLRRISILAPLVDRLEKSNARDMEISSLYTEFRKLEKGLVDPDRKRSLTNYFVICSAALMLPFLAACGYLQWSGNYERLLSVGKQQNIGLAHAISQSLWHRHSSHLIKANQLSTEDLRASSETRQIHHDLISLSENLGVLKVRVFSPTGRTIYSSTFDQIGQINKDDQIIRRVAANREAYTSTSYRSKFEGFASASEVDLVETYVPIINDSENVTAIVQVYTDVTQLFRHAKWHSFYVFAAYLTSVLLLFATMVVLVMRADTILKAQAQSLAVSNDKLRANEDELKRAHTDLQSANDELNNNIDALKQAQQEIIEKGKLAQLGQLTATVAHEIRNPLGSVRTAAFLLQRKLDLEELGIARQFKRIEDGVKRCDTIITELLSFARRDSLRLEPVDVDAWLKALVGVERENVPAIVRLEEDYGLGGLNAEIDGDQLQRVLINLISNASEAMVGRDGSEAVTESPSISIRTSVQNNNIEIAVQDNGPGITPENMEKIRQPLFTTKSFGVGLGIPAVEKILQSHGGDLRIETEVGQGTTMTAWFPIEAGTRARGAE